MSELPNEPIVIEIQFHDQDGILQRKRVKLTGERLDYYEETWAAFTLYRWLDKGYVVYVEDFKNDTKTLYPRLGIGLGYPAEKVAKDWPRFANTVGIIPEYDMDFDESSP